MSRSFFVGAFIAVAIRWAILHPVKALIIIGGLIGSLYLLVVLDGVNTRYKTEKAQGLSLTVVKQFGVEDGYGGSWQVRVDIKNETGRDIKHFSARCGENILINDATGLAVSAQETRVYEVGTLNGINRDLAACVFSDIEFGSPTQFDHAITYGRVS